MLILQRPEVAPVVEPIDAAVTSLTGGSPICIMLLTLILMRIYTFIRTAMRHIKQKGVIGKG